MNDRVANALFNLINQKRIANNKPVLVWEASLYNLSLEHSFNVSTGKAKQHDGYLERRDRIPFNWISVGELVSSYDGKNEPAGGMLNLWMNSPGHLSTLMGDYSVGGIACVYNKGVYYFTLIFAKR